MHRFTTVEPSATQSTTTDFEAALEKTKAYLRTLKTIKILIPDCRNFGHQASSISILFHLVALGFSGHFIVVGENQGALEKLRPLLPVDPGNLPPYLRLTVDGQQVTLSFTTLRAESQQPGELALTGGYDWPIEFLRQLECPNIVELQHYQWTKYLSEHAIMVGNKKFDLTACLRNDFPDLAFYREIGQLDRSLLQRFQELPAWKEVILLVTTVLELYDAEPFYLCPVYGINTGVINPQRCLFNLVSGIADLQMHTSFNQKAVVLIFSPQKAPGSIPVDFNKLSSFFRTHTWPGTTSSRDIPSQACVHWLTTSLLDKRVNYFTFPHDTKITRAIQALRNQDILLVQVGPVPAVLFDYVYSIANMPVVFEGQNTAGTALNLGKPYFHLTAPGSDAQVYPLSVGYDTVAWRVQQAANALQVYPGEWEENRHDDHPNRIIGRFIREVLAGVDDNKLLSYFKALREFYHHPENDKLRLALNFLVSKLQ